MCPICNATSNLQELDPKMGVLVCASCGHTFSKSQPDPESIYNPAYFLSEHKNWFLFPNTALFKRIVDFTKKTFSQTPLTILDVGCGKGDLLRYFADTFPGNKLVGIDLSDNLSSQITYIKDDFVNHAFVEKFDVITGLMVIEHISDPKAFVKKVHELLATNGITFLVTINNDSVMYRLARVFKALGWRGPFERLYHHHHLQHYTVKSLRRLMEDAGFTTLNQKTHNFPLKAVDLPSGGWLLRAVYYVAVAFIFGITNILGGGMNQTIVCKKTL